MSMFRAYQSCCRLRGMSQSNILVKNFQKLESYFKSSINNTYSKTYRKSGDRQFSTTLQWVVTGCGVLSCKVLFNLNSARCEARVEPAQIIATTDQDSAPFPWVQFLKSLLPHIIALSIALATAVIVAVMNTKIGVSIGSLVNVLSANLPSGGTSSGQTFYQQVKDPAVRIVKLYATHAAMTFAYIYSLAVVG